MILLPSIFTRFVCLLAYEHMTCVLYVSWVPFLKFRFDMTVYHVMCHKYWSLSWANGLCLKWHFLLPQEWVEGETVNSKLTGCICNLPIKNYWSLCSNYVIYVSCNCDEIYKFIFKFLQVFVINFWSSQLTGNCPHTM